jgi:hypothetical protein
VTRRADFDALASALNRVKRCCTLPFGRGWGFAEADTKVWMHLLGRWDNHIKTDFFDSGPVLRAAKYPAPGQLLVVV